MAAVNRQKFQDTIAQSFNYRNENMDQIQKQARIARRRLTSERFFRILPWTLSIALGVACLAMLLPKLMPLNIDDGIWYASWTAGLCAGCLTDSTGNDSARTPLDC